MLEIIVAALVMALLFILYLLHSTVKKNSNLERELAETVSSKHSLSTKYGKMSEQFFPFLENYPYDYQNFRFIGTPVDGLQFEDDKIIFVEFKSSKSRLSQKQKTIKALVDSGRVGFEEFRLDIDENNAQK